MLLIFKCVAGLLVLSMAVVAMLVTVGSGLTMGLSAATLQDAVAKSFPKRSCSLGVACLEVSKPAVQLPKGSDRVVVAADVIAAIGSHRYPGKLAINGRIRYVRESGSVFLDDVQVERLEVDGLAAPVATLMKSEAPVALRLLLTRQPVYVLTTDSRIGVLARRWLHDVEVADGKLRLTFQLSR